MDEIEEKYITEVQRKGALRIHERNKSHKHVESLSGPGSSIKNTEAFRKFLVKVIDDYEIGSMTDVPCGDWHWMSHVDLDDVDYQGCDIVPELIADNERKFPMRNFILFDAINQVPRKSDLIICRDFLFHLSYDAIERVLSNFRESGSTYLITTTFDGVVNTNLSKDQKKIGWGWRKINVEADPINLGEPLDEVVEGLHLSLQDSMYNRKQKLYRIN